jgi:asparagine synthase (glutamine-hydrolysing)
MCGIRVIVSRHKPHTVDLDKHDLSHRGPDMRRCDTFKFGIYHVSIVFYRLAIIGVHNGDQPFHHDDIHVACNGEIYNYRELIKEHNLDPKTDSDCEVIILLYKKFRDIELVTRLLSGVFAFVLVDETRGFIFGVTDYMGVRPLYYNYNTDNGSMEMASEQRGINRDLEPILLKPGMLVDQKGIESQWMTDWSLPYDKALILAQDEMPEEQVPTEIRYLLRAEIAQQLHADVPIGFLVSGGVDSSAVFSIAVDIMSKEGNLPESLDAFTFYFEDTDAPDVDQARIVVAYIRKKYGVRVRHHLVSATIEEGIRQVSETVRSCSTFDTTTIRAATPMRMLAYYIRERTNVRVVFSGEGADEAFGGYVYFKNAPSDREYYDEINSRLNELYLFDIMRADRATSAHSLELRVPLLGRGIIDFARRSVAVYRNTDIEKYLFRKAVENYLPKEITWRTKDAFSDAVGTQWVDKLKEHAETLAYPSIQFRTREESWYIMLYYMYYRYNARPNKYWRPKWTDITDPSARQLPEWQT